MSTQSRTEKLFENKLGMYPHLKYIRNKLWLKDGKSRVSVMVGAGFSLNANIIEQSLDKMSDWPQIKERLIERLPHHKSIELKNVLDIGQIYVDEYGRTSLDEILKTSVPDNNYEPSRLHYDLLRLPWSDVYTTNYDTLLERTRSNLYERSYEVIYNISDIPGSIQPRIIKLHGSFPAQRPFVFTQRDYENYPSQFSPFVNMVQQSIMETTFLLIGFSGDDPNFEQWTSWVSKNLGEHMPKIYMIGIGQKERLNDLNSKGITLIDFEEIYKNDPNRYHTMFTDLFEFFSFQNKKQKMDWPYKSYGDLLLAEQETLVDKIKLLEFNRESYPNWVIIPDVIRRGYAGSIRHFTERFFGDLNLRFLEDEQDSEKIISLINELLWCYKIFLIPLGSLIHRRLKQIIELYDKKELFAEILLVLLKESRLDCQVEEFNKYQLKISTINLTTEQQHESIYEVIQLALFFGEIMRVEEEVNRWNVDSNEIGWILKKAVILERIQHKEKSIDLFKSALQVIRRLLTIQPDDYRLLSFESVILNSNLLLENERGYDKDRSRYLQILYCNTNREFEQIALSVKPYEYSLGKSRKKAFDPDIINVSYSYGDPVTQELLDSYALISINELFNYKCAKKKHDTAIENLKFYHPFLSIIKRINLNNSKGMDDIISREYIYNLDLDSLESLLRLSKNVLNHPKQALLDQDTALEMLSRIYFALPNKMKSEIDKLTIDEIKNWEANSSIQDWRLKKKKSLEHLVKRIFRDKNSKQQSEFLEEILKIQIMKQDFIELELYKMFYFDPILVVLNNLSSSFKVNANQSFVDYLFENLEQTESQSLREGAIIRIFLLIKKDALSYEFITKFKSFVDQFKAHHKKDISDFLWNRHIDNAINNCDLENIIKDEKIATQFLLKGIPLIEFGEVALTRYMRELSTIYPDYVLSQEQQTPSYEEYQNWLAKFFEWWATQKTILQKNSDIHSTRLNGFLETMITLKNNILGVIPKQSLTQELIECTESFFLELCSVYPSHSLYLLPSLIRLGLRNESEVQKIISQLNSKEDDKKIISLNCLYDYLIFINKNEISESPNVVKNIIFDNMRYTSKEVSTNCYNLLCNLFEFAPSIFDASDIAMLNHHLSYCLQEIKDGSLVIGNLEDFELISAMAGLASYTFNSKLFDNDGTNYDWKEYIVNHKLPEVRQYAEAFEVHLL
ncbi:SIR2 family protein [Paenibacillus campi]|uniref:SIR2 family NAD-dependent protein deacylase n=1 Tax=Paenibacillus campi TaxID=3106031 RepID=UPI002AFE5B5F|nr:SIR2 family protein [Paenibacillus sp. SGZ-1009]